MSTTPLSSSISLLAFGSDHAGFQLKEALKLQAQQWNYGVQDYGTNSAEPVDYSDYIVPVVEAVLKGALGVLVCGSGIGMSIGANRFKEIRAALCLDERMAKMSRTHNNANILVLGARLIEQDQAIVCLKTFLTTAFEEGRHGGRIEKLDHLTLTCSS